MLNQSKTKLSSSEQQNMTRWAVYQAAALLKSHKEELQALKVAMGAGLPVSECIKAIERV